MTTMWTPILQFLTLIGGGIAIGTVLEDGGNLPVIIQQVPATPAPSGTGSTSPLVIIVIAALVVAAVYVIRAQRKN